MTDMTIEQEIQAKANKAPRVTPAALKDEIVSEHYFTAADGARMSPDNAHAAAVLYPAIERAMGELSKLHEGFNMEVNRAFNHLHDAFWSECPAPASAAPKRPNFPGV